MYHSTLRLLSAIYLFRYSFKVKTFMGFLSVLMKQAIHCNQIVARYLYY